MTVLAIAVIAYALAICFPIEALKVVAYVILPAGVLGLASMFVSRAEVEFDDEQ